MSQQLNVVSAFGGGGLLGYIDPKVGMVTDKGSITVVSGDVLEIGAEDSANGHYFMYTQELYIWSGDAYNGYSWPTGDGSVVLGTGLWPYEQTIVANNSGVFNQGDSFKYFSF